MPRRHVALRVLGLLGRGRDRVEPDVGEEDLARAGEDAAPAELAEVPVLGGMKGDQLAGTMKRTPSMISVITTPTFVKTISC